MSEGKWGACRSGVCKLGRLVHAGLSQQYRMPCSPFFPPPGPTLQKLATESKVALVLIKHLPLTEPRHVADVVTAVSSAVASPVWTPHLWGGGGG